MMTLTLLVSGCVATSDAVICAGTQELQEDLRQALLADSGDQSVIAGATLLRTLAESC